MLLLHPVSRAHEGADGSQVDGGDTFTEPSCIITGRPERQENVVVRVHDACFTSGALHCLHKRLCSLLLP